MAWNHQPARQSFINVFVSMLLVFFIFFIFHQHIKDHMKRVSITSLEFLRHNEEVDHNQMDTRNIAFGDNQINQHSSPVSKTKYTFKHNEWLDSKTPPFTVNTDFLIKPPPCPRRQRIDHLIVVKSATSNFDRRDRIRGATWEVNQSGQRLQRLVFLLGTTPNITETSHIQKEAEEYGDIIQGPFHDSYQNLTYKSVMGLKWISEHCSNVSYIIKLDDDKLVSMVDLMKYVYPRYKNRYRTLGCYASFKGKPIPRIRKNNKWNLHSKYFKGLDRYPFDYCPGFFVIITPDLIQPMMDAARVVPFFWVDDIYMYGLLPVVVREVTIDVVEQCFLQSFLQRNNPPSVNDSLHMPT